MRVEPLSDVLGVQLPDFDLKRECGPEEQAELRRLFCEHHLLLVRGQDLVEEDQNRFVGYFGPLHVRADGKIETYVSNIAGPTVRTGQARLLWHQDGTYGPRPGIATSLWAQEVSPEVVPTMFANAVRALVRMPAEAREGIEALHVVNGKDASVERTDQRYREQEIPAVMPAGSTARYQQPIVFQMPHTDQKTILVSELFSSHIPELPGDEGEALVQELFSRLYADDNVYVHRWQSNDLLIWDNLALQHCRPADMGVATRRMRRQSLDGWYTGDGLLNWPETVIAYAAN